LVFDVQGRTIRRLVDGARPAGWQTVLWDGRDDRGTLQPSGIYFYRLESEGQGVVRKLIRVE
jgi:flagellar hook assembly protein FlgD